MCREGIFVGSDKGKQRILHQSNFLAINLWASQGNRVNFGEPSEFTSESRQASAEHCDVTVSSNPFAFFRIFFGMGNFRNWLL